MENGQLVMHKARVDNSVLISGASKYIAGWLV